MNSNEMTVHGSTSPSNELSSVPQISDSHGDGNDHLNTTSTSTPSTCNITIDGGAIGNDNDKQEQHQEHEQQQQEEIQQQQQQEVSSNNNIAFNNPDDALEPIERLEKYTSSEIIFHR